MIKIDKKQVFGIIAAAVLIIIDFVFFFGQPIFYFLLVASVILGIIPFVISVSLASGKQKEIESRFLEFIRDLVENVKSGTPISKSIINLRNRDYGPLSLYIEKLSNQISLGIPLSDALATFSKDARSPMISRAVSLISEAERAGGQIDTILESVAVSVNQAEILKKERKSGVYNLIVQGYIIFIVFIIIMLVLQYKILPLVYDLSNLGDLSLGGASNQIKAVSSDPLLALILVQSFFTGFVIGKISEGTLKDGVKHSFILLAITLVISTGVRAFFG